MRRGGYVVPDLTGQVFGRLTVVSRAQTYKTWAAWHCSCACGKDHITYGTLLRQGRSKSCGCIAAEKSRERLTGSGASQMRAKGTDTRRKGFAKRMIGQVFGRLTVVKMLTINEGRTRFRCSCACGASKDVAGYLLRVGRVSSCGCARVDARSANMRRMNASRPPREPRPPKPRPTRASRTPNFDMARTNPPPSRPLPTHDSHGRKFKRAIRKTPGYYGLVGDDTRRTVGGKKINGFLGDRRELERLLRSITAQHQFIEGPQYWGFEPDCPWSGNRDPEEVEL